jgi:glycerol-3-phosphate dehydrogenase
VRRIWRGQVATLEGVLTQRLRISVVSPEEALECASECVRLVAATMRWSSAEHEQQVQLYGARLARFRVPSGVAA